MSETPIPEEFSQPIENGAESKEPLFGINAENFANLKTELRNYFWWIKDRPNDGRWQQKWDRVRIFKKGLPVAKQIVSYDDEETLIGDLEYKDRENISQAFNPDKKLPPERKEQIAHAAIPILKTTNLLFHNVRGPGENIPLIAKTGLVSRALGQRFTRKKYKGMTIHSSGWGLPPKGSKWVDVWDKAGDKENIRKADFHLGAVKNKLEYKIDPTYKASTATNSFVIRLKNPYKLFRYGGILSVGPYASDVMENFDHSMVKFRISPDELVGLVIREHDLATYGLLLEVNAATPELQDKYKALTAEEILEILGSNIEMPIYDKQGNELWPERVSVDVLLKNALNNQVQEKE